MRALSRRLLSLDAVCQALTCTALACLPVTLRLTAPDAAFTLLLPLVILGLLGTALIWRASFFKPAIRIPLVMGGLLLIFVRVGQLGSVFLAVGNSTFRLITALLLPSDAIGIQVDRAAQCLASYAQAWADTISFAQRAVAWLATVLQAGAMDDPAARTLFLAIGVWLLSIWAGWRTLVKRDVLSGSLPVTAALALVLDRSAQDNWPLWLHLGALLFLLALTELSRLMKSWRREHRDYSDSIPEELLIASTVLSVLILTAAFAVSTFSLKDFIDRFRKPEPPAASASSSSSGSARSGGTVRIGGAGLEGSHFIGAGPTLTQDVVMLISTGDLPPMPRAVELEVPRYYWRSETFQHYSGRGWHNPVRHDVQVPAEAALIPADIAGYRTVHVTVELPGGAAGAAYWTGTLIQMDSPLDLAWRPLSAADAALPLGQSPQDVDLIGGVLTQDLASSTPSRGNAYRFTALVPQAAEDQLRLAPLRVPGWVVERYTQLPSSLPERVRALARDLTARGRTPYDRAVAIESYLRAIPYSLDVPAAPSDRDATDFFLFDLKKGYCDYYATAMTVLARAAGLPARFVTGYATGSYDPLSAEYTVRQADAHAWTEIYFTDIGWVEFEPTASQPLPRRPGHAAESALGETSDRPAEQRSILQSIDVSRLRLALWAFPMLGSLALAWLLIDGLRLRRLSPGAAAQAVYRRMRHGTRRAVATSSVDQTALEYARAFSDRLSGLRMQNGPFAGNLDSIARSISDLTRLYLLSTFAPTPLSSADGRRTVTVWSRLRWQLLGLDLLLLLVRRPAVDQRARRHA